MINATQLIELIFSFALFINALLFIPQAIKIYKEKSAKGVSLITFIGFILIQFATVMHGFIHADLILTTGYLLSMLTCGLVIFMTIYYRIITSKGKELNFADIVAQIPGHIYWKDKDGTLLGCNNNNWKDFGLTSLVDFQGKTDYDIFPKEQADLLKTVDEEIIRTAKPKIIEEELNNKNGMKTLYLSHKAPLFDKKNNVIGLIGVSLDITHAKKETIERLEMLEEIIAVMPGNVYWLNKDGVYLGCNDNQAKAIGLSTRKDIVGKRNSEIPGFLIPEILDPINMEVMKTGKTIIAEEPAILADGSEAIYLSNKVPLYNSSGEITGILGISIDITERKKAEKELKVAKEAAEAANKAKTEFLYNMKHDLRTPFSGIVGIAEFLESTETDLNKKESLSYVVESAKILLDHLNEIFEFIHTENGQLPILEKQFDLHKLLQDIHKMMLPTAKDKGIDFFIQNSNDLPQYVIGDRVRTQRILMNLTSNAVKFTQQGSVKLYASVARQVERKVIIDFLVKDTGVGIPIDKQDFIFEQFNRLTSAYSGVYSGKGLGLRMVKHFLDELGGEAQVESKIGKGSMFKVLIPYRHSLLNCPEDQL